MGIASAAWCVACGAMPDVAITVERRGVMMHYGACWDHAGLVAARARIDTDRIDTEDRGRAVYGTPVAPSPLGVHRDAIEIESA